MDKPATEKKPKRPVAVTIVGTLLAFQAAFLVIIGALVVWGTGALGRLSSALSANGFDGVLSVLGESVLPDGAALLLGVGFLLRGLILLIIVAAFFRLRPWSWVLLMAWGGFNLATELIRFVYGRPDYLVMLLLAISVFLLNQEAVQEAFKLRGGADEAR